MDSEMRYPDYISGVEKPFVVHAPFQLSGDQGDAVDALYQGYLEGDRAQTLKGVTGSGKTFTMAKLIEKIQKPTLILSHNKTLSQLSSIESSRPSFLRTQLHTSSLHTTSTSLKHMCREKTYI